MTNQPQIKPEPLLGYSSAPQPSNIPTVQVQNTPTPMIVGNVSEDIQKLFRKELKKHGK